MRNTNPHPRAREVRKVQNPIGLHQSAPAPHLRLAPIRGDKSRGSYAGVAMAADLFGLEQAAPRRVDRKEAATLVEVMPAGACDGDRRPLGRNCMCLRLDEQRLAVTSGRMPGAGQRLVLTQTTLRQGIAVRLRKVR